LPEYKNLLLTAQKQLLELPFSNSNLSFPQRFEYIVSIGRIIRHQKRLCDNIFPQQGAGKPDKRYSHTIDLATKPKTRKFNTLLLLVLLREYPVSTAILLSDELNLITKNLKKLKKT
jgi:hypothetical protein